MTTRIRIGNQTAFSAASPTEPLDFALTHGFDAFEWFADKKVYEDGNSAGWDVSDMDANERREVKQIGESREILFTVHAPWQANPLRPGGNQLLMENLEFAQEIGADLVNLHLYMDEGAEGFVEALRPVIDYAAKLDVRLAIENTPLTSPADVNDTFANLQASNLEVAHVGLCLDIGHANLCALTRNDYIRYYDQLDTSVPLIHAHVHENYGDADSHLTLFTGPAAQNDAGIRVFAERLIRRRYRGAAIMEQWPQPPELLVEAERRLRQLLGPAGEKREPEPSSCAKNNNKKPIGLAAAAAQTDQDAKRVLAEEQPLTGQSEAIVPHSIGFSDKEFLAAIVTAHETHQSWRERLGWVTETLTNRDFQPDPTALSTLSIYLRFLGTGALQCEEDGRHFRPNHHAKAALAIEERLAELTTPATAWVIRKIYPWLPSYSDEFRRREPLTRIRDIAHRNDIPKDLKHEVKHRLQNKLHRCAGPEDLRTSEEILARITAPTADYAPEFVKQFEIFHHELSEFFNATDLERRLQDLKPDLTATQNTLVGSFLALKAKESRTNRELLALLKMLTDLRSTISQHTTEASGALAQRLRMADIALEDYAFVLLSECANRLEDIASREQWDSLLIALKCALVNLRLNLIEVEESTLLVAELKAWSEEFQPNQPFHLHRLMASLERMQRLAQAYTDRVLQLFPKRVRALGDALGVQNHVIQTFCEGDIRGNVIFQLSKLVELAHGAVRESLGLSPWDPVVQGKAMGKLLKATDLQALEIQEQASIVLLANAEGDEEIPTNVRGILLGHPIPHLSHLGVRARQSQTPFATAYDRALLDGFEASLGQQVVVKVGPEALLLESATLENHGTYDPPVGQREAVRIPKAVMASETGLLPLGEAEITTCGAKASGARRLLELAVHTDDTFHALPGLVVPFGVMELCLSDQPELRQGYSDLLVRLDKGPAELTNPLLEQLRKLVHQIPVPDALVQQIQSYFGDSARLAVRSSANGEDLEHLAGAGLYDSVIGVAPADSGKAIQTVWASLWTRRAALSRDQADIPHEQIHMAVLIQEMVIPELSFIMHTADPNTGNREWAWVELAVGLGETLASADQPGTPYRLLCNRATGDGDTRLTNCASFSYALRPNMTGLVQERLNYAGVPLSSDPTVAAALGKRLVRVASDLEDSLGLPQDVEGVIANDRIIVVQTRPQQGIEKRTH